MSNFIYNPGQKGKQELINEFVVRQNIYEEIMQDIETSDFAHPEQHYLLIGQRGMGKTTLLLRLRYGIEESIVIKDKLLPITFPEEQYQINELAGLWEYIAEYLEEQFGFSGLYDEIEEHARAADFQEISYELLNKALQKQGKNLMLLIDNIGDFFRKLEPTEMRRLREILQINSRIRVIGGSTNYMEEVLDYHQPFYEFFKIIRLDGLNKDETIRLILRLGETHGEKKKIEKIVQETPARIETLRILTGGVPRTIAIMFGIFLDYEHEDSLKDLHKILDVVTPLYKHRMDDLPVQQQKIIDAVARHWEPITVKELALRTRLISKTLSAQLNQLEKEQIVVKHDTANRNKTYMIRERFWNIWYLMRYGKRDDKQKIIWLVKFLEGWFSDDDLKKRIDFFVDKVKRADIGEDQLEFFSKVYAALRNLPPTSKLKLKSIEKETKTEIVMNDEEWFACAKEEFAEKRYYESLRHLMKVRDFNKLDRFTFLAQFTTDEAMEAIKGKLKDLVADDDEGRSLWILSTITMFRFLVSVKMGVNKDYESMLNFLYNFLQGQISIYEFYKRAQFELTSAIRMTAEYIKCLISAGLYNSVFKVLDESSVSKEGKDIFIKDLWKPLYLAVKYLYQPEELQKQPSELSTAAFEIIARITRKEDPLLT